MKKPKKLITYVLMVSRTFPAYHPRKGQLTDFPNKIVTNDKGHTCRGNYKLWAARAEKINRGDAVLSLRYWLGKPYKSRQVEFLQLTSVNVQKAHIYQIACVTQFSDGSMFNHIATKKTVIFIDNHIIPLRYPFKLAARDGLNLADFNAWFKKPVEDAAIIHFTPFFKY